MVVCVLLLIAAVTHSVLKTSRLLAALAFLSSLNPPPFVALAAHLLHRAAFVTAPQLLDNHVFVRIDAAFSIFWSLSVEEIFYLVWAPIVLLCKRRTVVICAMLPIVVCPFIRIFMHTRNFVECFSLLSRVDALMFGACVSLIFAFSKERALKQKVLARGFLISLVCSCAALCMLCIWCGLLRGIEVRSLLSFAFLGYSLLGLACGSCVGLLACLTGHALLSPLRFRPFLYIGSISYMVYLIHIPVYVGLYQFVRPREPDGFVPGIWLAVVATMITLGLASISWRFFEFPILRLKDRKFRSPSSVAQDR